MPSTTRCPFCGSELRRRTFVLMGREVFAGYETCTCPEALVDAEVRHRAEEEARRAEEERERLARYERAGIMPRFIDAEHPLAEPCADDAEAGRNVYVFGKVGRLKTQLASATARALVDRGHTVRFSAMWKILDEIKKSFRTDYDPLPAYQGTRFLVLDDLGKESPTGFALERVFALVDERSARLLPTIVTTQYRPSRLIERLAENGDQDTAIAIVSRLRQDCRTVELTGPDRRLG